MMQTDKMTPSRGFHSDNFWVNKHYDEKMEARRTETSKASKDKKHKGAELESGTAETTELSDRIKLLYGKSTKEGYVNLQELEVLSEKGDTLYPYSDDFIAMLNDEHNGIRIKGFRLLCKQAKWDSDNKINEAIDDMLAALRDEKPTAVRQALQYLKYVVPYKKELNERIKKAALSIDYLQFKDTMRPLIVKDVQCLLQLIEKQ